MFEKYLQKLKIWLSEFIEDLNVDKDSAFRDLVEIINLRNRISASNDLTELNRQCLLIIADNYITAAESLFNLIFEKENPKC